LSNTLGMSLAAGTQREAQSDGLVHEAANGDSAALIRLYEVTSPEILGFILNLLSTRDVAEEVLLDTYTDAWRQCPSVELARSSALDWLKALARARAVKRLHSAEAETNPAGEEGVATGEPPPEYLKDLLLVRTEREPQNLSRDQFEGASAGPRSAFGRDPEPARAWLPWVLMAALVAAGGLLFYNWRVSEQARVEASRDSTALSKELGQLGDKLKAETVRTEELEQIDAVLRAPGARVLSVESLPLAPHVALAVLWNVQDGKCLVMGTLPVPQTGKQYQLWLTTPSAKNSIAQLKPDSNGRVFMTGVPFAPASTRQASLQITLEPQGGSPQPSTDTYASGRIG
jgi:DNA-directed RNA polymerase specialized sigma24 family protein